MKSLHSQKNLQIISVLLALVGLLDSLYLWWTKISKSQIICGVGECDVVNASPYASLLGIPVAAIGAVGYAVLLLAALWALIATENAPEWLLNARLGMASAGLFFAAYLTVIEIFVIHAI
jgi:uncharacterized membrane protein